MELSDGGVLTSVVAASLVLVAVVLPLPTASQHCSVRGCCPGRDDECTMPYQTSLCYCDVFCERVASDCCPDFLNICSNAPRSPVEKNDCKEWGATYQPGQSIKRNCNKCACVEDADGEAEFACDDVACLIDPDIIEAVNSNYPGLGWRASNYSFLWGLTQDEGVLDRLGTFPPGEVAALMSEVKIDVDNELPETFDSREKWPGLIDGPVDQGNCGSSWAVSTASVASDRIAIQSGGRQDTPLSAQQLLSCNVRRQQGCRGGHLDTAWRFMWKTGVVSQECYPYRSGLSADTMMKKLPCIPSASVWCPEPGVRSPVYRSSPPYRIAQSEADIMAEIHRNGPVQATFLVRKDFFVYSSGVYRHQAASGYAASQAGGDQPGWHSVKIVGWGVDTKDRYNPIKYWLCVNSWGRAWGEDGLFRIVRGENESEIESFVLGVWMGVSLSRRSG